MSEQSNTPVRVRFAPSPTGYLHLGGVRTAIFNYLFARKHKGSFILRIDDTDRKRHQEDAVRVILEGMKWIGMEWDEGPEIGGDFGPYFQFERTEIYNAAAKKLEESGRAYWEKKEPKEVPDWKIKKLKKAGQWDEDAATAAQDDRPALYFKMHTAEPQAIGFKDAVWGAYDRPADTLNDFVLIRGDGTPTYNFASVVDDIEMKISHVIRGEDHMANTCKQIGVFQALGAPIPVFAHLPMIYNDKKQKMSKRRDPVSVTVFKKAGILPEGLFNYLSLLGWSPGDEREVMTKSELIEAFSLDRVKQSPAQFSLKRKSELSPESDENERAQWLVEALPSSKLEWINGDYLARMELPELLELIKPFLKQQNCDIDAHPEEWLNQIIKLNQERSRTLTQLAGKMVLFFNRPTEFNPKAVKKVLLKNDGLANLKAIRDHLAELENWTPKNVDESINKFVEEKEIKLGMVAQPLRVALSGTPVSPPIHDTLALLGKEEVLHRINHALGQGFEASV